MKAVKIDFCSGYVLRYTEHKTTNPKEPNPPLYGLFSFFSSSKYFNVKTTG